MESLVEEAPAVDAGTAPALRLHASDREPLTFVPYFVAGGRHDGAWRLTWMQVVQGKERAQEEHAGKEKV